MSNVWNEPIFTSLASCETLPEICNAAEGSAAAAVEDDGSLLLALVVAAYPEAAVEGEKSTAETSMVSCIFLRVESTDPVAEVVCIRLISKMNSMCDIEQTLSAQRANYTRIEVTYRTAVARTSSPCMHQQSAFDDLDTHLKIARILNQVVKMPHILIVFRTNDDISLFMHLFRSLPPKFDRRRPQTDPSLSTCLPASFMMLGRNKRGTAR